MYYKDGIWYPTLTDNSISGFFGSYRFLSNFYPAEVVLDGIHYQSSEAAYMAQKTTDIKLRKFFATFSASQAKVIGRNLCLRNGWNDMRLSVMLDVLRAKFAKNNIELRMHLLDTGDKVLIEENNWNDTFWGVCNGVGENNLGRLLMQIRGEIQCGKI
jgi:hypothetical protein